MHSVHETWKADLHVHTPDVEKGLSDATANTADALLPAFFRLIDTGDVNALTLLCHDGFPTETYQNVRKALPDVPIMVGTEITVRLPTGRRVADQILPRTGHLLALFPEPPQSWDLPQPDWKGNALERRKALYNVPWIEEAVAEVTKHDGITIAAHPSQVALPWGSMTTREVRDLHATGVLPTATGIEHNHSAIHRFSGNEVDRLADRLDLPVVGGSDAHRPNKVGSRTTLFARQTGDVFEDLKSALFERATVVGGTALMSRLFPATFR